MPFLSVHSEPNAVFKFNSKLNALTVHATKPIAAGSEVLVCYGFPTGVLLRSQRQKYFAEAFGFACRCEKCSLTGASLEASDRRLGAIGHPSDILPELRAMGATSEILRADPGEMLGRLEHKYRLMQLESPGGHLYGIRAPWPRLRHRDLRTSLLPCAHLPPAPCSPAGLEAYLHYFVEFCDSATSRLRHLVLRGGAAGDDGNGGSIYVTLSLPGKPQMGAAPMGPERVRFSLYALQDKALAYARASYMWASRALGVMRDVHGVDSPTFACWSTAMAAGCWDEDSGTFDFFQRFMDAGLSEPLPSRRAEPEAGSPAPPAPANTSSKGSRAKHVGLAAYESASRNQALPLCTSFMDLRSCS